MLHTFINYKRSEGGCNLQKTTTYIEHNYIPSHFLNHTSDCCLGEKSKFKVLYFIFFIQNRILKVI